MKHFEFRNKWTGELVCKGDAIECGKALGVTPGVIYDYGKWRTSQIYEVTCDNTLANKKRKSKRLLYTVYDRDDNIVCTGTAEECASILGYSSKNTFYSVVCKTKKGITSKYTFVTGYQDE